MQLRQRPDDSEKVEDLQYQADGAVDNKRRAQKTMECLQSQLDTFQAIFDSCRRGLPTLAEAIRTHVTDGFGDLLFKFI